MKILTFGEPLLRLKPPDHLRIAQAASFEAAYGGAEANAAVSLALLGDDAAYLTKLPANPLGDAVLGSLRRFGVDTSRILRGGPRLGVYYFEKGTDLRPASVVYDRAGSSAATAKRGEFDWPALLDGIGCFYFSGITPAVSGELAGAVEDAVSCCRRLGIPVVCDLNYRAKLWAPEKARAVMTGLMESVDVCLANDEDFNASLGIRAFDGDLSHCIDQADSFRAAMREITKTFPHCGTVASILRNARSTEEGDWMAILLRDGRFYETPVRRVRAMEGVGAGDAFGAALTHCLLRGDGPQDMIDFAFAASLLKLTVAGDQNLVGEAEIRSVMKKSGGSSFRR
mgnify:FL=1